MLYAWKKAILKHGTDGQCVWRSCAPFEDKLRRAQRLKKSVCHLKLARLPTSFPKAKQQLHNQSSSAISAIVREDEPLPAEFLQSRSENGDV